MWREILHTVLDLSATPGFHMDNFLLEAQTRKNAFSKKFLNYKSLKKNLQQFSLPLPISNPKLISFL